MRSLSRRSGAVACLLALLTAGCASVPAPKDWLPTPEASAYEAFGGWLEAEYGPKRERQKVEGELIAVTADSLYVLVRNDLVSVPKATVRTATVAGYDNHAARLGTWALLGTLSTLSHGAGLIISAPVWVLSGIIATASAARAPLTRYPDRAWEALATYARFPQGLPPGLDRSRLRASRWS